MYERQRRVLNGTALAKHSMNQRVMKRASDREQAFYRAMLVGKTGYQYRETGGSNVLVSRTELRRLLAAGLYADQPHPELSAVVHLTGSALNRIRPVQLSMGG